MGEALEKAFKLGQNIRFIDEATLKACIVLVAI